jgi:protein-L-isoaspartate(D-aspartate) O-methyltransferase
MWLAQAALSAWLAGAQAGQESALGERARMVAEQIESRGVYDHAVLEAMRTTPRHLFVPERLRVMAYQDRPLPIGHGATISQPFVVALMTSLLEVKPAHRVLEIGTGSGYQAAVLGQLARRVYTIEIVPELAESARLILGELGYQNVVVREGDGYLGWPEQAPFDRILLTAAPSEVPEALIRQLANGGRLVAPVGASWDQDLVVIEKDAQGKLHRRPAGRVTFVPMRPGRN